MGRAYSADLRGRVIEAVEAGSSARSAAARFDVGVATAIRWVRRHRETGERTARRQGHRVCSKLDAHEAFLMGLIEETLDITHSEMRARMAGERGIRAGLGTLWRVFYRRGLRVKKRPGTRARRNAPRSARRARPGSRDSPISTPSG
jgi:transposase